MYEPLKIFADLLIETPAPHSINMNIGQYKIMKTYQKIYDSEGVQVHTELSHMKTQQ